MSEKGLTKAAFAQMMGVDRSQATRWAQSGLPVQADDTIDPVAGAEWVRANVASYARDRRSGGAQQMRQAQGTEAQRKHDDAMICAVSTACHAMLGVAAEAALKIGLSLPQAFAMVRLMQTLGGEAEAEVLTTWLGVSYGPNNRPPGEPLGGFWVDWENLAKARGLTFDRPALDAYATPLVGPEPKLWSDDEA